MMVKIDESASYQPMATMEFVGGELCLDFVNTASGRSEGPFRDRLKTYGDLVTWAERIGLLSEKRGASLRVTAAHNPRTAEKVVEDARRLREAMYRVFAQSSENERPAQGDIDLISRWAAEAAAHQRLVRTGDGYSFEWAHDPQRLELLLWPVARSAAELLVSPEDRTRVKQCQNDNCNWLFLDVSKNRSRRWCDMKECGNRHKARRHYERHRKA